MCRSIHTLYHIEPPVSQGEIGAAALQYVRKISGYQKPSKINEQVFLAAVEEVEAASSKLIAALETTSPPRERSSLVSSRN